MQVCDGGGSNNSRHYIVKQDLYKLAQSIDMNIVVAHYPPYCSKWNPIEHKLFAHVHRAWDGAVFQNIQIVKELAENTATKTGLEVKVKINTNTYQTKRIVEEDFKENLNSFVFFDPFYQNGIIHSLKKIVKLFFKRY
jgi:Rhodopirellula transposase DDE domain